MTDSRSLKREVHTKHFITSPVSAFHAVCESLVVGNNKTLHHGGLSERNLSYFPKAVCIGAEQCTADIKKKKKKRLIYLFISQFIVSSASAAGNTFLSKTSKARRAYHTET